MSVITKGLFTNASTTATTVSSQLLAANNTRQFLFIENAFAATTNLGVTLDGSAAVIGAPGTILLTPGSSIMLDICVPSGAIMGISGGITTPATIYWM